MAATASKRASVNLSLDTTAPLVILSSSTLATSTKFNAATNTHRAIGVWSSEEHDRFLEALKKYPQGPWKAITKFVSTRSVRQVQTHAQKYQEKVSRRLNGLQTGKTIRLRREHRIDHEVLAQHTLISFSPELRNKYARPSHHHEVKPVPVSMPPVTGMPLPAHVKTLRLQCPTNVPVAFDEADICPIINNNGSSPSSVSSSFLFDDAGFAFTDMDDLPTLSESLDFFIENFS
ncbi:hypothetical protein KXD40_007186 [Peronospora effusa]|uniref:Uncharacterized protein n=1 Tax=Peronospora effusa TaxID=542832 RepID=A0A3M6VAZ0_9STRA|nr:hypothetical protein DD238_008095 [Peronospora effusa]UIZ29010.1 hypothetical protein KXD40_007186 [Peronospora effusa]CAI5713454.1 unnamed protein product [Peronospora effusa]